MKLLPHLDVDLQSCLFLISHQNPLWIHLLSHAPRTKHISHSCLDNLIVICPEVHTMKPFIQSVLQPYLAPSVLGKNRLLFLLFCFHDATVLRGRDLLIVEAPRSHSFTQHIGRTPLDEWSARRRELYLTKHYTQRRQKSMPQGGFESAMLASEQQHTDALDRNNTGIRSVIVNSLKQTAYCTHHLYLNSGTAFWPQTVYLLPSLPRTNFDTIQWRIYRMASGCVLSEVRNKLSQLTRISYFEADTWLWRLVACPSVQSLGLNRSRVSPCDNCGGRSSTGIGFLRVLEFSLVRTAPPILTYLLTYLLTYSIEQSPSWECNSFCS
jgi:hypothetical protein